MAWYTYIGVVIIILILYSYLSNKKWRIDLKRLSQSRPMLSKAEYIGILAKKGYDSNRVGVAYDVLQEYIGIPEFSLYLQDDFKRDYQIDPEDYEDLIVKIFDRLQLTLPEQKQVDTLNKKYQKHLNVEYVLELLKFKSLTPTTE